MNIWENPAVVGLIVALPASLLGVLGWLRSRGMDADTKEAGVASGQAVWMGQVQEDNRDLRAEVRELRQTVEAIQARLDAVEAGSTDLRAQNRELTRENGVLHEEVEALKAENVTLKDRIGELERVNGNGK